MIWIAPSEKHTANAALGKRHWSTTNQFHANSALVPFTCWPSTAPVAL